MPKNKGADVKPVYIFPDIFPGGSTDVLVLMRVRSDSLGKVEAWAEEKSGYDSINDVLCYEYEVLVPANTT